MGSVNRDNPAALVGSGGRLEEDQSVGPNSARRSRSIHKTVELSFPQAHGLSSSEARDQHLPAVPVMMMVLRFVVNMEEKEGRMFP